jgi:uncharacterized protein YuzE
MNFQYDSSTDVLYIKLNDLLIADSEEIEPHVVVDHTADNQLAGIIILYFVQNTIAICSLFSRQWRQLAGSKNTKKRYNYYFSPENLPVGSTASDLNQYSGVLRHCTSEKRRRLERTVELNSKNVKNMIP